MNQRMYDRGSCSTVSQAMEKLREISRAQDGGDAPYLDRQSARYMRSVARIKELYPPPRRILDIGSHYLHQAVLLHLLGYELFGLDIELFTRAPFIEERAKATSIQNFTCNNLEKGDFLPQFLNSFDLIVFTETLEHITFNPINFWKRVYELLAENGAIYLTTPNSIRATAFMKAMFRLISGAGIGITVGDIFETITYGHHWKEYSAGEIRDYFGRLSPDFEVETHWYSDSPGDSFRRIAFAGFHILPFLRAQIEAVIRLPKKTRFVAQSPQLQMTLKQMRGVTTV